MVGLQGEPKDEETTTLDSGLLIVVKCISGLY
jgi:hypothetical protein